MSPTVVDGHTAIVPRPGRVFEPFHAGLGGGFGSAICTDNFALKIPKGREAMNGKTTAPAAGAETPGGGPEVRRGERQSGGREDAEKPGRPRRAGAAAHPD